MRIRKNIWRRRISCRWSLLQVWILILWWIQRRNAWFPRRVWRRSSL